MNSLTFDLPSNKRYHSINGVDFTTETNPETGERETFFKIDISCLNVLKLAIPYPFIKYERNDTDRTYRARVKGGALPKRFIRGKTTSLFTVANK